MGNSAIYYYPADDGPLVRIDFGECVTDYQETPIRNLTSHDAGDWSPSFVDYGGRQRIRIILERFDDRDLAQKLRSLENHLLRGKPIGFTVDTARTWGAFASGGTLSGGTNTINHGGNLFTAWDTGGIGVGEYVEVSSQNPEYHVEEVKVSAVGGLNSFTVSPRLGYHYDAGPVFLRHDLFQPVLYVEPSQVGTPILTHDRRLNWTLSLTCMTSPPDLALLYTETGGIGLRGDVVVGGSETIGGSLQSLIDGAKVALGGGTTVVL